MALNFVRVSPDTDTEVGLQIIHVVAQGRTGADIMPFPQEIRKVKSKSDRVNSDPESRASSTLYKRSDSTHAKDARRSRDGKAADNRHELTSLFSVEFHGYHPMSRGLSPGYGGHGMASVDRDQQSLSHPSIALCPQPDLMCQPSPQPLRHARFGQELSMALSEWSCQQG
jgi:hypothetical protein